MTLWLFTRLTHKKGVSQWVALVVAGTLETAFKMLDLPVGGSVDGQAIGSAGDSEERVVFAGYNTLPL